MKICSNVPLTNQNRIFDFVHVIARQIPLGREKYVRELKDNNEIIFEDKTDSGDLYIHKETAFYHNKEDGIRIGVDEQRRIEYVLTISYRPNSKVMKSLKCVD